MTSADPRASRRASPCDCRRQTAAVNEEEERKEVDAEARERDVRQRTDSPVHDERLVHVADGAVLHVKLAKNRDAKVGSRHDEVMMLDHQVRAEQVAH